MSLYRIKPLEWDGDEECFFTVMDTADYQIRRQRPDKWLCMKWLCRARGFWGVWTKYADSLEAGKAACEAHWQAKLAEVLEEVVVSKCWECGPFRHCIACGDVGVKIEPAGGPKEGK